MSVSSFPPVSGGTVNNDFVVDMNNSANNSATLARTYSAGGYSISFASTDLTFDVYLLSSEGITVGYSKLNSIVATAPFDTVVILGVDDTEFISFAFTGAATDTNTEGLQVGAGAYVNSILPTDLPEIDDTTTVSGGNFAADVEIYFLSGEETLPAKAVTRSSSLELIVTRPDGLDASLDPWTLQAVNPGVPVPAGSNVNKIEVTAGSVVTWVTSESLPAATFGDAYSSTLVASDPDGSVTYAIIGGSFPGLTLATATGVLSGDPTGAGNGTVRATDLGGNHADKAFSYVWNGATGGTITYLDGKTIHTFDTSGDFIPLTTLPSVEYIVLAGGGGGGREGQAGGGGGGGLLASITGFQSGRDTAPLSSVSLTAQTYAITIGGGGGESTNGSDTSFASIAIAIGGGYGGGDSTATGSGGSGGGDGIYGNAGAGSGTAGQGFDGGTTGYDNWGAGGGGTYGIGQGFTTPGTGGLGTHNFLDERGWGAGGGGGRNNNASGDYAGGGSSGTNQLSYAGSGGHGNTYNAGGGVANFGGGGGGEGQNNGVGGTGGSGKVVIRY
jgi:hypothetical protein